ncbi:MAG: FGGY-family carbohydrate kinase [Rhodospirillales bacterium]
MKCVLGLDIGTTSTIGILIALPNQVLAQASRQVSFSAPHAGWAEEDPNEWWRNVCALIPELIKTADVDPGDIQAVGVTGMLPALVLLGGEDEILRPSIQQSDARNGAEVAELAAEIDTQAFVQKTGNGVNQQIIAPRLRWIERHEPEVFSRIKTVFGSYDYINWRLTGAKRTERNWALEAGFVDLETHQLSLDLIALGRIPPAAVPPIAVSDEIIGCVTEDAAEKCGLKPGTPVVGGAADHMASGFAAGVTAPGDALLKFGGSTDILVAAAHPKPDPRMFLDYHIIPGLYMPNGCMATGGSGLNWFVNKIAQGEHAAAERAGLTPHQYLDALAAETPPGAGGVLAVPYFLGEKTPIHDTDARGIITGLSLNHDLGHMWRALLEGYAHAFRHHVEVLNDMGHETSRFLASDGGSNSRLWMQICADVLQQPVQLLKGHPGSCLGAAWCAAVGGGLTKSWTDVSAFVSYGDVVTHNPGNAEIYTQAYHRFRAVYEAVKAVGAP